MNAPYIRAWVIMVSNCITITLYEVLGSVHGDRGMVVLACPKFKLLDLCWLGL